MSKGHLFNKWVTAVLLSKKKKRTWMHNAKIQTTVFSNLFHTLVHTEKDWNRMTCSQETSGLLGPASPSVTRISRPEFLQSMPLKNVGKFCFKKSIAKPP